VGLRAERPSKKTNASDLFYNLRQHRNVHDVTVTPKLLTGDEKNVYGDSGYLGAGRREDAVTHNNEGKKIRYKINHRPSQSKNNSLRSQGPIKRREREKSSVRAKVEHVFGVVKGLFGIVRRDIKAD
jgi:IS5 family transposase